MGNSSSTNSAQESSNADLDALERQITEPRAHALTMMDGQTILGLIQRLREAEGAAKIHRARAEEAENRSRAFEHRLHQLERVREAATELDSAQLGTSSERLGDLWGNLRIALAAHNKGAVSAK